MADVEDLEQSVELLHGAVYALLGAMAHARHVGLLDYIDCCDDSGEFWEKAIANAHAVLVATESKGPVVPEVQPAPSQVEEAIRSHLSEKDMELKGECSWHSDTKEWRALVAVTPWGPLVVMGFRLSVCAEEAK